VLRLALDSATGVDNHESNAVEGTIMDLGGWLRSLGLGKYEAAFRENEIDETVLPRLTTEDLKDLGVSVVGHRRKLLDAIAALQNKTSAAGTPAERRTIFAEHLAERRQVTVMFSDLVGSTALSARMDPGDFGEVVSAYHNCIAQTVRRLGGFVATYTGDGVIVYLGYPEAHEDDAEQAVRAGLEMVVAVRELKTHAALQTRVGIATGLVVVGDLFGSGASGEQSVVGETHRILPRACSALRSRAAWSLPRARGSSWATCLSFTTSERRNSKASWGRRELGRRCDPRQSRAASRRCAPSPRRWWAGVRKSNSSCAAGNRRRMVTAV
jgi:class 3 adenylate cyclase